VNNLDFIIRLAAVGLGLVLIVGPGLMKSVKFPNFFVGREPDDAQIVFELLKRQQKNSNKATIELCKKLLDALLPNGT